MFAAVFQISSQTSYNGWNISLKINEALPSWENIYGSERVWSEGSFCVMLSSPSLLVLLPLAAFGVWIVGSGGPYWPWKFVKVRSGSLAAVPARRMTASLLTLKLLFSSFLLPSSQSGLSRKTLLLVLDLDLCNSIQALAEFLVIITNNSVLFVFHSFLMPLNHHFEDHKKRNNNKKKTNNKKLALAHIVSNCLLT